MKKKSSQLLHPVAGMRIRSWLAVGSVCVLVSLVAFFAGAHAQIATPSSTASATPAPTATPFSTVAPRITPRP
jgi:hypothetical protein